MVGTIKQSGIEAGGFFIIGAPDETFADLEKSIQFAIEAGLDYIALSTLVPYPGTPLYEKLKDEIDFSLFPYKNAFKNGRKNGILSAWEKIFYRKFYLRPAFIFKKAIQLFSKPKESLAALKLLIDTELGKI